MTATIGQGLAGVVVSAMMISNSEEHDLTPRQMQILLHLAAQPVKSPPSVKHVAAALGLQKPVITRAVNRMENLGLVSRSQNADDKREVNLAVGKDGTEFLKRLEKALQKVLKA